MHTIQKPVFEGKISAKSTDRLLREGSLQVCVPFSASIKSLYRIFGQKCLRCNIDRVTSSHCFFLHRDASVKESITKTKVSANPSGAMSSLVHMCLNYQGDMKDSLSRTLIRQ
ncbi:hypothetical protein MKW98_031757 [Papaver atlanticum]|uniref:Uncharacterized protein n=1 Tax=Papaver atlanticum TaxID=357466 RepID=A0AAD4S6H6_9MAGN|nr:hypothetical protein MKW98_031757 [Papaver atlanticum]